MIKQPTVLNQLIAAFKALPGVGPKTAHRMAFHLLQYDRPGAKNLAAALEVALSTLTHCQLCNTFSETDICSLCANDTRRQDQLCIVEMPADILLLEQAKCFEGVYFVLMGRLSPLDNLGIKDLDLTPLFSRLQTGSVKEVVIATNFTAEGELTAHFLIETLRRFEVKLTRIARGMPVGGELEFVDPVTLAQSIYERRDI